jgi:hypothetical protein
MFTPKDYLGKFVMLFFASTANPTTGEDWTA